MRGAPIAPSCLDLRGEMGKSRGKREKGKKRGKVGKEKRELEKIRREDENEWRGWEKCKIR